MIGGHPVRCRQRIRPQAIWTIVEKRKDAASHSPLLRKLQIKQTVESSGLVVWSAGLSAWHSGASSRIVTRALAAPPGVSSWWASFWFRQCTPLPVSWERLTGQLRVQTQLSALTSVWSGASALNVLKQTSTAGPPRTPRLTQGSSSQDRGRFRRLADQLAMSEIGSPTSNACPTNPLT